MLDTGHFALETHGAEIKEAAFKDPKYGLVVQHLL